MTTMRYHDHLSADRRLAVLRLLEKAPGFRLNDRVLAIALERLGHMVSAARLGADLSFLSDAGLLHTQEIDEGDMVIAILTREGADVARGRSFVKGVRRPEPESST